jgi:deoxyribonucleoside regulator
MVGIGNLQSSVFRERDVLKPSDIEKLERYGAVGEIMGRFYDANGRECDTPYRRRIIGFDLESLRGVKRVVAVVAGADRTAAIAGAIRGKIVKSLVIDDAAAKSLLQYNA